MLSESTCWPRREVTKQTLYGKELAKKWAAGSELRTSDLAVQAVTNEFGIGKERARAAMKQVKIGECIPEGTLKEGFKYLQQELPAPVRPGVERQRGIFDLADDICNLMVASKHAAPGDIAKQLATLEQLQKSGVPKLEEPIKNLKIQLQETDQEKPVFVVSKHRPHFAQFISSPTSSAAVSHALQELGWSDAHIPVSWDTEEGLMPLVGHA
eukprot:TRINITY_DN2475_c0_g1_i1.p1 TRINITY_DN2475_c0_g1~~TRINITY_DN2475_c0_g1_i1.p1  ORF type:complete len:212 (+),score=42.80 TRINITY_DN2475_c0_g1_i1:101-736(+)